MNRKALQIFIFLIFIPVALYSQNDSLSKSSKQIKQDSVLKFKKFEMQKSPMGAVVRSLILPGWGQFYVEKYWKVPIVLGAAGFMTYLIIDYNNKFIQKRDLVDQLKQTDPNNSVILIERQYREFYRDNRDMSAFYLLAVYLIAAIDCYSDAHLYDFNVDDKLTFGLTPNYFGGVNLNLSIKLWK